MDERPQISPDGCLTRKTGWATFRRNLTESKIIIKGDSQLVINQIWGTWRMNAGAYIPLALKCKELLAQFTSLMGQWIPREENYLADSLSKSALEKVGIKSRKWK